MKKLTSKKGIGIETSESLYVKEVYDRLNDGLQTALDKGIIIAGAESRKLIEPSVERQGVSVGKWVDDTFVFSDDYVPSSHNSEKLNMGQIKKALKEDYQISFDGIPYIDGVADFRTVAVANISTVDIICKAKGITREEYASLSHEDMSVVLQEVFGKSPDGDDRREHNFCLADQIAAERQFPIPGLPKGYTAKQLAEWREKNKFSWDEQLITGYSLVPTVIHGNLRHTGLVGTANRAASFLKRHNSDIKENPERYCCDEEDAPISMADIEEIKRKKHKKRGGNNMARGRTRGIDLGRWPDNNQELNPDVIRRDTEALVQKADNLHKLGEKIETEKEVLEDAYDRVKASGIKESTKKKMLAEIEGGIEIKQEEYDRNVADKQVKVQVEIQEQLERMEGASNELGKQEDSLRELGIVSNSTDASAAADVVGEEKREFEQMKAIYAEKKDSLFEAAKAQRDRIRARRSSWQ